MKVYSTKIALVNNSSAILDEIQVADKITVATSSLPPGDSWMGEARVESLNHKLLREEGVLRLKADGGSDFLPGRRHQREALWTFQRANKDGLRVSLHLRNGIGEQLVYISFSDQFPSLADWMKNIPDDTMLSELNIPGSNQSASYGVLDPMLRHQHYGLTIEQQLAKGIRFIHLEVAIKDGEFVLHDGQAEVPILFGEVLEEISSFLSEHPSETVLVLLKAVAQTETEETSRESFTEVFLRYLDKYPALWHLGGSIPVLKQVRGKIVLWRGFANDPKIAMHPLGIDADTWHENSKGFTYDLTNTAKPQSVYVQNIYNINFPWNIERKFLLARQVLVDSVIYNRNRIYVNYFAAAGLNDGQNNDGPARYTPLDMAEGYVYENMVYGEGRDMPPRVLTYTGVNEWLNMELDQYLSDHEQTSPPHAIFVLDYLTEVLCEKIVKLNFIG